MKRINIFILSILFLLLIPILAQEKQTNKVYTLQPESKLWLDGTSTLHDFKFVSNGFTSEFNTNSENFTDYVSNKNNAKFNLRVTIPVINLKDAKQNEDMDDNMYDAMNEEEYKNITYELTSYQSIVLPDSGDNWYSLKTKGNLTIANVTKIVEINVLVYKDQNGSIHFKGSKLINMEDYKVEPPTMMFGVIKTDKNVTISFELLFK